MSSSKSVNKMDSALQLVNSQFVTLQPDEKKYNMKHYQCVIEKLVELMKNENKLFKAIFQNLYWAGSFYDGLKVGKPEEFDVDVVMKLPIDYDSVEFINRNVKPPFVKVKMAAMKQLTQSSLWTEVYRAMEKWTDEDGFLLQAEFRQWMEKTVNKALNSLPRVGNAAQLDIDGNQYLITLKKTGPAMTLNITIRDVKLDVDFVPVIEFKSPKKWPPSPVRKNTVPKKESWFIVPKPNSKILSEYKDDYWRLAFHDQEREMITGNEMGHLKNACRLLKKFRDKNNFKSIASYYIKTMFLWEIAGQNNDTTFWKSSLSNVFMTMLGKLAKNLKDGSIKYFWDDRYNLLSGMSAVEKQNVENRINRIIKDIEKKSVDDPTIIAFHLLTTEEFSRFEVKFPSTSPPRSPVVNEEGPEFLVSMASADTEAVVGVSLENVVEILNALQSDFIQQRKLTQLVLNKVTNLQESLFKLTEDNAMLRDELKLLKQTSRNAFQDTDLLLSFEQSNVSTNSKNVMQVLNETANDMNVEYGDILGDTVDSMLIL